MFYSFVAITLSLMLTIYALFFIPRLQKCFHRLRVWFYFTHTHPKRHLKENSVFNQGSDLTGLTLPLGVVRSLDYRENTVNRSIRSCRRLRVLTWNIEFGYCLERIATELIRCNADIICLQEVKRSPLVKYLIPV